MVGLSIAIGHSVRLLNNIKRRPNFDFRLSLFRLDFSNWYDDVVFLFSFYCKNETLFKRFISNHF
jgi:hypothetical protein